MNVIVGIDEIDMPLLEHDGKHVGAGFGKFHGMAREVAVPAPIGLKLQCLLLEIGPGASGRFAVAIDQWHAGFAEEIVAKAIATGWTSCGTAKMTPSLVPAVSAGKNAIDPGIGFGASGIGLPSDAVEGVDFAGGGETGVPAGSARGIEGCDLAKARIGKVFIERGEIQSRSPADGVSAKTADLDFGGIGNFFGIFRRHEQYRQAHVRSRGTG